MAEPEKYWTKDDFMEHVHKELNWSQIEWDGLTRDAYPISDTDWDQNFNPYNWIFWSREHDDPDPHMTLPVYNWDLATNNPTLKDKVRFALRKFLLHYRSSRSLVQFWAATTTSDGRTLLTTQGQPFGLTQLSNPLCEYRMICKDYTFYVDGMNGEELGIPGRVYRNKCPEFTPEVAYYSVKENPQRDHALRCGVRESLTLPVIEQSTQICVGVLELVAGFWFWANLDGRLYAAFEGLGLECFDSCEHHEMREKNENKAHKHAFMEMDRVLKLVCKSYELLSALMWVQCGACTTLLLVEDLCSGWVFWTHGNDKFSIGRLGHHLRNGIGVVDRALSSSNLLYCSDVTQLSMAEYPLAHTARRGSLRDYFAISLRSSYTGNDVYILEIFLPASNKDEDPFTSLSKILQTMNKEFKTFRLASGEKLREELSVEVIEFQNGQKGHYVQTLHGSLPSPESLQNGGEIMHVDSSYHRVDFKKHVHKKLTWSRIDFDSNTWDEYPISDNDWDGNLGPYNWIFWSREHDGPDPLVTLPYDKWGFFAHAPNNRTLKDNVRLALRKLLLPDGIMETLVQFWAATTTSDGQTLLTTQDQPFSLTSFSNHLCKYRMISMDYTFYVDRMNGEEDLGIPGRVYHNKCPECTPNVAYYSVKECPQRNRTLHCGVRESLHLPVIEHSSQICVGVLEIVGEFCVRDISDRVYAAFQGPDLDCFDSCEHHEMQEKNDNGAHKDAFSEIERVLKRVCKIYKLPLAQTWVPCRACTTLLPVKDLYRVKNYYKGIIRNLHDFSMGRLGHHLRNKMGVVGKALSSPNLSYCSDVTQLSMAEYHLAHFARQCRLRGCFAISLSNNHTGNDVYVLEIFLPTSNKAKDPLTLLSKILQTMKKEFNTFRLASGEELGGKLSVEVIEFQNGQKHPYVQTLHDTGSLPNLEPLQSGGEIVHGDLADHQSSNAEQCEIDGNHPQELGTKKTSGREHKKTGVSIEIPYEDIMKYSKLSRSNAAKNLQVSISTFKRVCRKYGISRWPPRNVDKVHPPRPSHVDHQEVTQLNSNLTSNQASASIAHTQPHDTVMQNANTVNVKVKYVKGLTVLFPLSLSSTLEELYECIETRLHLSRATYHACYIDGDNDKITITCDQDVQFWLCNSPRLPGSNAVVLHIDPISQVYHTKSVMPVSYIDCFPSSLRPYIGHVKDVALDGNCGFRATAGLMNIGKEDGWVHVRRDLLIELNSHVDDYKIMYGGQQRINELTHCLFVVLWMPRHGPMDDYAGHGTSYSILL